MSHKVFNYTSLELSFDKQLTMTLQTLIHVLFFVCDSKLEHPQYEKWRACVSLCRIRATEVGDTDFILLTLAKTLVFVFCFFGF